MSNDDVIITLRLEKDVKEQADFLFEALGLDLNVAINVFLRQSIRDRGIPFQIKLNDHCMTIYDFIGNDNSDHTEGEYWQDGPVGQEVL